jgi:hypothetical protein
MPEVPHVVVDESDRPLSLDNAIIYAIEAKAFVPAEEDGDDAYHFLFPGNNNPKLYTRDELAGEIRSFNNPDSGE